MTEWKPDVVIYHDPCLDGFTAAWAAWRRWPDAQFIGANYGQQAPDVAGKNVLIVDFSYKRPELEALAQIAASIVILDHHKTARDDLEPFARFRDRPERFTLPVVGSMISDLRRNGYPAVCALFDMERSGARIAWDFTHGRDVDVPWLVLLVEDRDLWRFTWDDVTRDFGLRLSTEPKNFHRWSQIAATLPQTGRWQSCAYTDGGSAMRAYRDWLVGEIAAKAEIRPIANHYVPTVDCPYELASEVGHRLCLLHPDRDFAALRVHSQNGTSFSLRSSNGFDVSAVAVKFGGGGHAGAAGFRVPPAL
ncbi:hypothetical protein [Novosphingobium sp.]|uniref:DHHA1 domain-containing protein n=1 Tax=Novosphingobium sp. TaxID=1874826 RepID=UPI0038BC816A